MKGRSIDLNLLQKFLDEGAVFHLATYEQSVLLSEALDILGKTWGDGVRYTEKNHWDMYEESTIYFSDGVYGELEDVDNQQHIVEFFELTSIDMYERIHDFFESTSKLAICCNTAEEEKTLLMYFKLADVKWCTGDDYDQNELKVENAGVPICYTNDGEYSRKEYFLREESDYEIIDFQDFYSENFALKTPENNMEIFSDFLKGGD